MFDAKVFLENTTTLPGVYQMLGGKQQVLYVGKAKNLQKRLSSYFSKSVIAPKTKALVDCIVDVRVTPTASEQEALILECNLIKEHKPKYNILMRDDKSYPYITLSDHHDYPRLELYRGKRNKRAQYFGPYPSVTTVRETLKQLQRLFKLRQCSDSFFNARSRPCLQYQINRCSAPCMEKVTKKDYQQDVDNTVLFLKGKSQVLVDDFVTKMEGASQAQRYEKAAYYRDVIAKLRHVQSDQSATSGHSSADVFSIVILSDCVCVAMIIVRDGQVVASRCFYPKTPKGATNEEVLSAVLSQYYFPQLPLHGVAKEIICNIKPQQNDWLEKALFQSYQRSASIKCRVKSQRGQWLVMATTMAEKNIHQHLARFAKSSNQLLRLQQVFSLDELPGRIECFDISHSQGEATVASCVVYAGEGLLKSDYRRFNIKDITPGDDYAAMAQVLKRRYERVVREQGVLPDVVLIDGGKGQLSVSAKVMSELLLDDILLVGVAKGVTRKAGMESLIIHKTGKEFSLEINDPALLLIQEIRDEAHRFAITGHRQQRAKKRKTSVLEDIPGIGAKRRRELLRQFGGLQGLKQASVADLAKVTGISAVLAQLLFDYLHEVP